MTKLLVAPLLLLGLAACGTSTAALPSPSASSSGVPAVASLPASPGTSASVVPSSSAAIAASTVDACGLLTKADVEKVVGAVTDRPLATSAPMTGIAQHASVCSYRGATGLLTIALLSQAMTRSDFDNVMRQVPGIQPMDGIGDAAYGASAGTNGADGASILVLKGATFFTLVATSSSGDGSSMLTQLKTLAAMIVSKL